MKNNLQRSSGLDLLRFVSMFMIIILHVLLFGGILKSVPLNSVNYFLSYFLESLSICAVNCFILISGYFLIYQKFRLQKLVKLWFEIIFYSYLFLFTAYIFNYPVSHSNLIKSLLPVLSGTNWFISCYVMLYILFPFYNKFILSLSEKETDIFVVILLVLFSLRGFVFPGVTAVTTNGYNILWISFVYMLGAYIRLNEQFFMRIKWYWYLAVYLLSSIATLGAGIFFVYVLNRSFVPMLNYNSIFIITAAVSLFCLFKKKPAVNSVFDRCVFFATPAVFGIYLIHINMFVKDKLVSISKLTLYVTDPYLIVYILIVSVIVFLGLLAASFTGQKVIAFLFNKFVWNIFEKTSVYLKRKIGKIFMRINKKYDFNKE